VIIVNLDGIVAVYDHQLCEIATLDRRFSPLTNCAVKFYRCCCTSVGNLLVLLSLCACKSSLRLMILERPHCVLFQGSRYGIVRPLCHQSPLVYGCVALGLLYTVRFISLRLCSRPLIFHPRNLRRRDTGMFLTRFLLVQLEPSHTHNLQGKKFIQSSSGNLHHLTYAQGPE
jgi:hypothetical protein